HLRSARWSPACGVFRTPRVFRVAALPLHERNLMRRRTLDHARSKAPDSTGDGSPVRGISRPHKGADGVRVRRRTLATAVLLGFAALCIGTASARGSAQ